MLAMNYMPENRDRQVMIGCRSDDENRVGVEYSPLPSLACLCSIES